MNRRLLYYYAGALVLTVLWFFYLYKPIAGEKLKVENNIADIEHRLKDYRTTLQELPEFIKTQDELESYREEIVSNLYAKNDILKLFRSLKSSAIEHNVAITEISPPLQELLKLNESMENSTEPQLLNLTIKCEGRYIDFGKYVASLEKSPIFRGINECQIATVLNEPDKIVMRLDFRALIGSVRKVS